MNLTVIGTGYVGLVSGTCFAEMGNKVHCIDIDQQKIDHLKNGVIPIYEPGLEAMVKRNVENNSLHFSTDIAAQLPTTDVAFIAAAVRCVCISEDRPYARVGWSFGAVLDGLSTGCVNLFCGNQG